MYHVFLSHSSQDKPAVEQIARRLREEGDLSPFLDKWHLVPGMPWQPALEQALAKSETVAVFFGPSGLGPWHHEEMRVALQRAVQSRDECRIIPVLLPGSSQQQITGFLGQRMWVDFREGLDSSAAFSRLVAGILGKPPEDNAFSLPDEPAPYRGLLAFDEAHSQFFFGREPDIERVLDKLRVENFVAVVGASGSGKSSLVQAPFVARVLRECKRLGLHTALDTNGYLGERLSDADLGAADLVLLDLKSWDAETHQRVTGWGGSRCCASPAGCPSWAGRPGCASWWCLG
jgi:hypothetical protein